MKVSDIVKYKINSAFGIDAPDAATVLGYKPINHPHTPPKGESYTFRKEFLRDICAFLTSPFGDALYISGPTGSGKTSGVCEVAARLNWPVQQVTANGRMELSDLVGQHTLTAENPGDTPSMKFMYGPLSIAMKEGHILLINEIDLADPAELSGLNDVLEGRPLTITQNGGELIKPHPMFRVVATGNSTGGGDSTGLYQGVLMQNIAAMDRYRFIKVDYADDETELAILENVAPSLALNIREGMVRVANEVRNLFLGEDGLGGEIAVTMSTRTLARWAHLSLQFRGAPNTLNYSLDQALLNRTNPDEAEAILRIAKDVFGSLWAD